VTVALPASDVTTTGTNHTITLVNAGTCLGGVCTSNGVTLTVTSPPLAPTITSISPSTVASRGPDFTLTVVGMNFASTSMVDVNGITRLATYGGPTTLTVPVEAWQIASGGQLDVSVLTPPPGGGWSNRLPLIVVGAAIAAPSTVAPGAIASLTISNSPGSATDWVGFYCPTSNGDGVFTDWAYLNNTKTPPGTGLTSATVSFQAPLTIGTPCEARLFASNSFNRIVTSLTIVVSVPPGP